MPNHPSKNCKCQAVRSAAALRLPGSAPSAVGVQLGSWRVGKGTVTTRCMQFSLSQHENFKKYTLCIIHGVQFAIDVAGSCAESAGF